MTLNLKKNAGAFILAIGLILFFSSLTDNNLNFALVSLTSALILWVLYGLLFDVFDIQIFAWVISSTGFLLALSIFFLYGVEEVAHPIGAILFHSSGIAGSLGIGLFSLFPLLILYQLNIQNDQKKIIKPTYSKDDNIESDISSDDWEVVSDEELESGKFEIG